MTKLTKAQHFVALLILLPSVPFALPLSILMIVTRCAAYCAEALYEWVGRPFLYVRRLWLIRCERVNAARPTKDTPND